MHKKRKVPPLIVETDEKLLWDVGEGGKYTPSFCGSALKGSQGVDHKREEDT